MEHEPIPRRQLAASLLAATQIADRRRIAAFVGAETTRVAPNPFARTTAGAVAHTWHQQGIEFRLLGVESAGLAELLAAVSELALCEALVREILRAGPHTAHVYHWGDGCRLLGAVLYGRPGVPLPAQPMVRARGSRRSLPSGKPRQLDLFAV